jgi:predicted CDP-diglyceride synthetase/phosphatidate cytidylyltransferase
LLIFGDRFFIFIEFIQRTFPSDVSFHMIRLKNYSLFIFFASLIKFSLLKELFLLIENDQSFLYLINVVAWLN